MSINHPSIGCGFRVKQPNRQLQIRLRASRGLLWVWFSVRILSEASKKPRTLPRAKKCPPDCCIYIFESLRVAKKRLPERATAFLVHRKGLVCIFALAGDGQKLR